MCTTPHAPGWARSGSARVEERWRPEAPEAQPPRSSPACPAQWSRLPSAAQRAHHPLEQGLSVGRRERNALVDIENARRSEVRRSGFDRGRHLDESHLPRIDGFEAKLVRPIEVPGHAVKLGQVHLLGLNPAHQRVALADEPLYLQPGLSRLGARKNEQAKGGCDSQHRRQADCQGARLHAPGRLAIRSHPWRTGPWGAGWVHAPVLAPRIGLTPSPATDTRSATRSLALRARGLAAASPRDGRIGFGVRSRNTAGAGTCAGQGTVVLTARPASPRSVCLTMRSSSEWKEITATRPPTLSARTTSGNPALSSPSSSFTAMRNAWKVRVAGWMREWPAAGVRRDAAATISASSRVDRIGRARTMARAMLRLLRSSPNSHKSCTSSCSTR